MGGFTVEERSAAVLGEDVTTAHHRLVSWSARVFAFAAITAADGRIAG